MPHCGMITRIMVESARITHFKSLRGQRKIVRLTAYSAPMTDALDPNCNLLLFGDSVAMARQMLDKTGADGMKLEGGNHMAWHVAQLDNADIAVLAHIGVLPQKATLNSCFRITSRTAQEAEQLAKDASAMYNAGAFGIVMGGIIEPVAASIAARCPVPSIGIGASPTCDGQIMVTEGILSLHDGYTPKFLEKCADLQANIRAAAAAFHKAVFNETFPSEQHLF